VFQAIGERWFRLPAAENDLGVSPSPRLDRQRLLRVFVEDVSSNCGANALETRKLLKTNGIHLPRSIIIVQDPTMSKRTAACFSKAYEDDKDGSPRIMSWPTVVPQVAKILITEETWNFSKNLASQLRFVNLGTEIDEREASFWSMDRFLELVWGEIPRLRDDAHGYGPKGAGFITAVDIPEDVETAWEGLSIALGKHDLSLQR
jgi:hypothetical protein